MTVQPSLARRAGFECVPIETHSSGRGGAPQKITPACSVSDGAEVAASLHPVVQFFCHLDQIVEQLVARGHF